MPKSRHWKRACFTQLEDGRCPFHDTDPVEEKGEELTFDEEVVTGKYVSDKEIKMGKF